MSTRMKIWNETSKEKRNSRRRSFFIVDLCFRSNLPRRRKGKRMVSPRPSSRRRNCDTWWRRIRNLSNSWRRKTLVSGIFDIDEDEKESIQTDNDPEEEVHQIAERLEEMDLPSDDDQDRVNQREAKGRMIVWFVWRKEKIFPKKNENKWRWKWSAQLQVNTAEQTRNLPIKWFIRMGEESIDTEQPSSCDACLWFRCSIYLRWSVWFRAIRDEEEKEKATTDGC